LSAQVDKLMLVDSLDLPFRDLRILDVSVRLACCLHIQHTQAALCRAERQLNAQPAGFLRRACSPCTVLVFNTQRSESRGRPSVRRM
jgi:hypothetical protein